MFSLRPTRSTSSPTRSLNQRARRSLQQELSRSHSFGAARPHIDLMLYILSFVFAWTEFSLPNTFPVSCPVEVMVTSASWAVNAVQYSPNLCHYPFLFLFFFCIGCMFIIEACKAQKRVWVCTFSNVHLLLSTQEDACWDFWNISINSLTLFVASWRLRITESLLTSPLDSHTHTQFLDENLKPCPCLVVDSAPPPDKV